MTVILSETKWSEESKKKQWRMVFFPFAGAQAQNDRGETQNLWSASTPYGSHTGRMTDYGRVDTTVTWFHTDPYGHSTLKAYCCKMMKVRFQESVLICEICGLMEV